MTNILLCSSNPLLVKNLYGALRDEGYAVETVEHPALAVQKVIGGTFDVIAVDSEPFGLSAEDAVQIIRALAPGTPVLFLGRQGDCGSAASVETSVDLEEFKRTVQSIAA